MPSPTVPTDSPRDLALSDAWRSSSGAFGWRHAYLIARQATDDERSACSKARVSPAIIYAECRANPAFADLRQAAIEHRLVVGNDDSSRIAREALPAIIQHGVERATSPAVRDRDQLGWARLTGEVAGALPGAAGAPVSGPVQIAVQAIAQVHVAQEAPATAPTVHAPARKGLAPSDAAPDTELP